MIKKSVETRTVLVFETATHRVKLSEERLDKILEEKKYAELSRLIQKGLRQIVDDCKGEWWEASWKEIFTEISGQKTL